MIEILTIGLNTFREAIRSKVLYLILFFMVLMIGSSFFLETLALDGGDRLIKNLGLSTISFFGLLVAMFIGVNLIPQEVESKTIYTIVSQGVQRWQFVLGKFLGLILTVYVNIALMTVMLLGILLYYFATTDMIEGVTFFWMIKAIFMELLAMLIVVAVAILFSSFSTPILSAVMTGCVYIIGQMTNDFWDYIRLQSEKQGTEIYCAFLKVIYYLCPHLDMLNLKKQVVHFEELGAAAASFPYGAGAFHAITYTAVILFIACLAFSKRDF
ncbi:MAG: ABC transporter permease subunit [Candidatus Omnitrophica bacterium]|nr:ABC transporter permease subunit [Candidatus Omnitrophota bacterium]MCA9416288.1 ABC transporter permease subunit [Candidatus Omnitrophota bacterium]MCA9424679.1 ABC transporter permease subunit [Candidatus Omnitrophota bacterium]MCA9431805.1 ABC transporter permease subunit [Candidatus Omnitrophota bacterium]MCA9434391.1 ABC transporter permease subunit [Candidatus Omnitrophota bacterium]